MTKKSMVKRSLTKRSLVIGASGFVGQYLLAALPPDRSVGTYCTEPFQGGVFLDLLDPSSIESALKQVRPDWIFVPASWTHVDGCEEDPERCEAINAGGVRALCEAVDPHRGKLIYFSTDYVFDGEDGPYSEDDKCRPVNVYGQSKWRAEQCIGAHSSGNLVLRTTVVYGWERGRRGLNSIQRLLNTLRAGEEWRAPEDQWGNPTYVENLVEVAVDLAAQDCRGTFHVCGADWVNRDHFCREAARVFGLPDTLIKAVSSEPGAQRAQRPLKAGMKTDKVRKRTRVSLMGVAQGLSRMKATEPKG